MLVKIFRVQILPHTDAYAISDRKVWDIVAGSMQSAWAKFCRQHCGTLKPDPSQYDISLHRTESR